MQVALSRSYLWKAGVLFLGYVLLSELSLLMQSHTQMATQVWPAAGFALFALMQWGPSVWPAIFLGTLAVHGLNGEPLIPFLGAAAGNSLEPVLGLYLCNFGGDFHKSLDRLCDSVRFLLGAALISTAAGTVLGVPLIEWTNYHAVDWRYWIQYWIGNSMGVMLIAPLLLIFAEPNHFERFSWRAIKVWEWMFFGMGLTTAITAFRGVDASVRLYFFVPVLLWAAMRLGQRGATLAIFVFSSVAIWYSAFGGGPFSLTDDSIYNEFYLYIFVATLAVTGLVVAAVVSQREHERSALKESEDQLHASHLELARTIKELEISKQASEAANAAKSAFLANMSHEIRTPLGVVLGFSELISEPAMRTDEKRKYLETIRKNGKLLTNVIDDILDLSKVEAGKMGFNIGPVELEEVIGEIQDFLSARASEKNIATSLVRMGDLPELIQTDPFRLKQVLINVIGNAVKFTSSGSISVTVRMDSPAKLVFEVTDTGKGIAPEHAKDLFVPFSQIDFRATRLYSGTGLGLALARRLAHKLGGDVDLARSTPGKGSTFIVAVDPGQVNVRSLASRPANVGSENRLHDLQVLVVDDNDENLMLVGQLLRLEGATAQVVRSGPAAIALARQQKFDVVLMDLQMPGMDGYQTTEYLRHDGFVGPIIALTAHAMKEDRARCLANGFNDHVSKPIERRVLVDALSRYVS